MVRGVRVSDGEGDGEDDGGIMPPTVQSLLRREL